MEQIVGALTFWAYQALLSFADVGALAGASAVTIAIRGPRSLGFSVRAIHELIVVLSTASDQS